MINFYYRAVDAAFPFILLYGLHRLLLAEPWSELYTWLGLVASGLLVLFTQLLGGYSRFGMRTIARKLEVVLKSWGYILLGCVFMAFLWGDADKISRWVFAVWAIVTPLVIIWAKAMLNRRCMSSAKEKNTWLVIGEWYELTDFEKARLEAQNVELLHCSEEQFDQLATQVKAYNVRGMALNVKGVACNQLVQTLTRLELQGVKLFSMNHFFERYLRKCFIPYDVVGVDYLDDVKPLSNTQVFLKRSLDILASGGLLLISLPALVFSVFMIKKQSPGSILFRQTRVGKGAKDFEVLKFRSMHENSHFDPYTQKEDPRIYAYGNFMRKSRIDELPQLWNVLKGDMHLIGPRTEWNILVENYEKEIPFYHERHLVRPGITGWAQVMYPYGANTEDARQKLMYDLYYIKHWSIWLELETLLRTVGVVLGKKGL